MIYSDQREKYHQNIHQKLIRKNNVLTELEKDETETEESEDIDKEKGEEGIDDDDAGENDEDGEIDHYKTMMSRENIYSYAYRDAISPAALIRLEECSDVSEDVYDSIKDPSESKVDIMSDTMSDTGDLFLSIR